MALPGSAVRTGVNTSESDWVCGEKASDDDQQQCPENAILYVLNNDRHPQWFYGYESGSTKAQRELKHVLAVYMFQLHPLLDRNQRGHAEASNSSPAARLATVIIRHESPSFTMISYRRLNDYRRSKKNLAAEQSRTPNFANTIVEGVQAGQSSLNPASNLTLSQEITSKQASESDLNQDPSASFVGLQIEPVSGENVSFSEVDVESSMNVPVLGLHSPHPSLCCPICCTPVNLRSHPLGCSLSNNTIDVLQSFLVMQLFMSSTPLGAFSFHFDQMDIHIQRQWLSTLSPFSRVHRDENMDISVAHQLVADVTSTFSLSNFVPDSQHINIAVKEPACEHMVLQLCANILLDVSSSTQQIMATVDINERNDDERLLSSSESCEQFCRWVAKFINELTQLLVARNTGNHPYHPTVGTENINTFPALVDEILSLIYGEAKYQSLRKPTSALLLRQGGSWEMAVQKLFRVFVEQLRLYNPLQVVDIQTQSATSDLSTRQFHTEWSRRWFLEPSVLVAPLSHGTEDGPQPSLLAVTTLLRMFACVDISLQGSQFTIESAITEILPEVSGTEIVLDGRVHSLDNLPSGLSTMTGAIVFGEFWSTYQYEGNRSDDGSSIDLLLFTLPSIRILETPLRRSDYREARRIRLQLHLDEMQGRDEYRFSVFAEMSSAQDTLQHTGQHQHDFDSISSWGWSPIMEVQATYIGAVTSLLATKST